MERNNLHYSVYAAYSGYLSNEDKQRAEQSDNNAPFLFGGNVHYGLIDPLDIQFSVGGANIGLGVKYSPDFKIPFRIAALGGVYTDVRTSLITPKTGVILSWHANENVTFSSGGQLFFNQDNMKKGEIFFSIDLRRKEFFKTDIPNRLINGLIPKGIHFAVSYPTGEDYKKVYLGISIRHEIKLIDIFTDSKSI